MVDVFAGDRGIDLGGATVDGLEERAQRIRTRLRVARGSLLGDPSVGIASYAYAGQKGSAEDLRADAETEARRVDPDAVAEVVGGRVRVILPGGPIVLPDPVAPVYLPPTIAAVTPATLAAEGGELLSVTGSFSRVSAVRVGGVSVIFATEGTTAIRLVTPALPSGPATVEVITAGGTASAAVTVAGAAMDLGAELLALHFEAEDLTLAPPALAWPGVASAGDSGSYAWQEIAGYDLPSFGPPFSGRMTVEFGDPPVSFAAVDSLVTPLEVLGADNVTRKDFTLAAVIAPLDVGTGGPSPTAEITEGSGILYIKANQAPNVVSFDDYLGIFALRIGGVIHVGFSTYDDSIGGYRGARAVPWPGGAGAWGSVVIRAAAGVVETWINGALAATDSVNWYRGQNGYFQIGQMGGGAYPSRQRVQSVIMFPRRLNDADLAAFHARLSLNSPDLP